jgi:hypothetical protein
MTDYTHTDLQLVGRHVPDPNAGPFDNAQQAQSAGYDTMNPVTGTYEIGVRIEGAFVPLISEKASLIFDRIEVAKQAQSQEQAAQPQQPAAGTSTPQTGEGVPQTGPQSGQAAPGQSTDQPQA